MGLFGLVSPIPSISRKAVIPTAAIVVLGAIGVVFTVRAPDNSDRPIIKCETASGAQTCIITGSGSASFSGAFAAANRLATIDAEGAYSGSGITLNPPSAGFSGGTMVLTKSGGLVLSGSNGGCYRIRANTDASISGELITCPTPGNF